MKVMVNSVRWLRLCGILQEERRPSFGGGGGEDGEDGAAQLQQTSGLAANGKWLIGLLFLVYFITAQMLYIFTYSDVKIVDVATICYVIMTVIGNDAQFVLLDRRRRQVHRFIEDLQRLVTQKMANNRAQHFRSTEKTVALLCFGMARLAFASYSMYVFRPAIMQTLRWWNHPELADNFVAPFNDVYYYFDASKSPLYELCYVLMSLALLAALISFLNIDLLFIGIAMYLVALYTELMHSLAQLDGLSRQPERRMMALRSCVRFHMVILSFIRRADRIFSVIVFVQLMYGLFTLATCVFAASFADSAELGLFFIHFMLLSSELFLFCYTGSLVLLQTDALRTAVYDLNWYAYSPREKQMVYLIMERTARQSGFRALDYVACNNDTFVEVMSNVLSALAFLQSVV